MKPFVFAIGPVARHERRAQAADRFGVLLMERLGRQLDVEITATYDDLLHMVGSSYASFAWLPPALLVDAVDEHGSSLLLAGMREQSTRYRGALFVKASRPWKTPADLRGLRVAWVDRISCAGYLFPRLALEEQGIDPANWFAAEHMLGDHAAVTRAVALGTADAGATYVADGYPDAPGSREQAGWTLEVAPEAMRDVLLTAPIPADAICASSGADATLRDEVARVLGSMHETEAGSTALADLFGVERLAPASIEDYDIVRRAMKAGSSL